MIEELESIINEAKEEFRGKKLVAFIGERYSGKTVVSALLKHALVNYFVQNDGKWDAWVTHGTDRINEILEKLNNGKFPAPTLPGDAKPITLEIFSGTGTGGGIKITLQDMAGESRDDLLRDEFINEDQRLEIIMKENPIEGKPYGILSYLPFSSIYVIIIDCSKYKNWNQEQSFLATTIHTLLKIKKATGTDFEGKIMDPIAIIFSKYDQIPQEEQDTAENLLKKLPEFSSALNIAHRGIKELFVSEIKSVNLTENELIKLVDQETERIDKKLNDLDSDIHDLETRKISIKKELIDAEQELNEIEQKLNDAKSRNVAEEIEQITREFNEHKVELDQIKYEITELDNELNIVEVDKIEIEKRLAINKPTVKELEISKFKPLSPLAYNTEEYLRFISWIIEMSKE